MDCNINDDLLNNLQVKTEKPKVSIFGMGYVGAVTAACLAAKGYRVIGVDPNTVKTDLIRQGLTPIIEKDLPELFQQAKDRGLLTATDNTREAVLGTEMSLICVGTPSKANGAIDDKYLLNASQQIATTIREKSSAHVLVYRSTMLPGLLRSKIIPLLEEVSGKKEGEGFHVCFNPEFLRESTSVHDFFNPPKTVVGTNNKVVADLIFGLYSGFPGPMIQTSIQVAEMVKYVDNTFHALKVTFANEIGQVCRHLDIDSHEVMNIFSQDTKLNISRAYLTPGFAFGGSCLPKDLRAINYLAKTLDLDIPLLASLMESNRRLIEKTVGEIIALGVKRIGFAGFTFKAGTDDLRESPIVMVIEQLIGKGFEVKLYDRHVAMARLIGANKDYINKTIPHLASLMVPSLDILIKECDVIVIGNRDEEFREILSKVGKGQTVYDFVRINGSFKNGANYIAIA
ncbi:MAG TPA: nucleotide sugar dehydrogenase [Nitrospira sp.]|nr:nucleotide sugar dehydrogenase [Nitrospira sp.]